MFGAPSAEITQKPSNVDDEFVNEKTTDDDQNTDSNPFNKGMFNKNSESNPFNSGIFKKDSDSNPFNKGIF